MKLSPYLNFKGTCREAFEFYHGVLGGEIVMMQTFGESPNSGETSPELGEWIMHARLVVNDSVTLMGSDAPPEYFVKPQGTYVALGIDDTDSGKRIFDALADGGAVQMPFEETFWAEGFGMVVDRFGTPWMVNCERGGLITNQGR